MNTKRQSKTLDVDTGEKGVVLIAAIALMAVLALVGVVAAVTTSTEIKISSNYNTSVQASYIARAGVEHARQKLKFLNEGSPNYDGLILVIGEGCVRRIIGYYDSGTFNGAILIANTTGGVLGSPSYTTLGTGKCFMQYCSTAVDNAVDLLSFLKPVAVRDIR